MGTALLKIAPYAVSVSNGVQHLLKVVSFSLIVPDILMGNDKQSLSTPRGEKIFKKFFNISHHPLFTTSYLIQSLTLYSPQVSEKNLAEVHRLYKKYPLRPIF